MRLHGGVELAPFSTRFPHSQRSNGDLEACVRVVTWEIQTRDVDGVMEQAMSSVLKAVVNVSSTINDATSSQSFSFSRGS